VLQQQQQFLKQFKQLLVEFVQQQLRLLELVVLIVLVFIKPVVIVEQREQFVIIKQRE